MIIPNFLQRFVVCTILLTAVLTRQCRAMSMDEIIASAVTDPSGLDFMYDEASGIVKVEMDMLYDIDEFHMMEELNKTTIGMGKRQAIQPGAGGNRWSGARVPYEIDYNAFKSQKDRDVLHAAMNDWMKFTCIKFEPATSSDFNRIEFVNGEGCASYVGRQNKKQDVLLAAGCRYKGTVIHELGHALGLHHEQTRPDRDQYVKIHYENIKDSVEYNFKKYSWSVIEDLGVPYDYASIMHYGGTYFAEDKSQYTIETMDKSAQNVIGNRKGLSFRDIKTVNLMYNCRPNNCNLRDSDCVGEGFVGKDCRCWCPSDASLDQDPYVICQAGSSGSSHHGGTSSGQGQGNMGGNGQSQLLRDTNTNCPMWAARGYCQTTAVLQSICQKSCRSYTQPQGQLCTNQHQHCDYWMRQGHCTNGYRSYMQDNCKKACGLCTSYGSGNSFSDTQNYPSGGNSYQGGGVGSCRDQDTRMCQLWSSLGYCTNPNNVNYMRLNCPASCRVAGCGNYYGSG